MKYNGNYILGTFEGNRFRLSVQWQVLSALLLSVVTLVVLNVVFGLVYRNFDVIQNAWNLTNFLRSIGMFAVVLTVVRRVNARMETNLDWDNSLAKRIIAHLFLPVACSILAISVFNLIFDVVIFKVEFIRFLDQFITVVVTSFGVSLVLLSDFGIFLLNKWKQSATEVEKFKKENMEFRFDMLRNQVNPHFLFNSLNTLASLIYENQDQASDFVRQLAKVYRYILENKEKELINLQEEHVFLESYLYLIQIRFASGLHIELDLNLENNGLLAPMTIQLLVENAIKHNVVSPSRPLQIKIFTDEENNLVVTNTLQKKAIPEPSTKTGLDNIRNRYKFLSDRSIEVIETESLFTVKIPLIYDETK